MIIAGPKLRSEMDFLSELKQSRKENIKKLFTVRIKIKYGYEIKTGLLCLLITEIVDIQTVLYFTDAIWVEYCFFI